MNNPEIPQSEEFARQDQLRGTLKELMQHYGINTIVTTLQEITSDPSVVQDFEFDIKLIKKGRSKPQKLGIETVSTLAEASGRCGVPVDKIMTTRDIEIEFNKNRKVVHEWTRSGPHGEPHLTPLPVRLEGSRNGRLLFSRHDVEELAAHPPKQGRPRK